MNKNLLGILGSCQRDCIFHGPLKEAKSFGACASKKDDSFKSNQWHSREAKHKGRQEASLKKLIVPEANLLGCQPYSRDAFTIEDIVVLDRGGCTFVEKLHFVSRAGAAGVIVVSDNDEPLNPSYDPTEEVDDLEEYGLVVVTHESGKALRSLLGMARQQGGFVTMEVEPEPAGDMLPVPERKNGDESNTRFILLGGKPILNMLILV